MTPAHRAHPVAIEAEQAVLGGLLISTRAFELIEGRLREEDFSRVEHRLIFRAICQLADLSQPWDAVSLTEWFQTHAAQYMEVTAAYILELASTTPSAANILAHADIVREKAILRQIIDVCYARADCAFNPEGRTSQEVLAEAETLLQGIADARPRPLRGFVMVRESVKNMFKEMTRRLNNPEESARLPTGFVKLDKMIRGGFQPGELVILAARHSMGKTALALNIAEHAVLDSRKAVVVFSMEMSATQLGHRLISSLARVNNRDLCTAQLSDEEWSRVTSAMVQMGDETPLFIDDTSALSPLDIRSRACTLAREHPLGLIVVDYLQLMQVSGNRENRVIEISEISRNLKALAKDLNVPVIVLSQLNRSLESRTDKRPVMSDLRESGTIEQDADIVLFIYRDEHYNPYSRDKGLAEVIIGKQRNGPTGVVKLAFHEQYTRFDNARVGVSGRLE